MYLNISFFFCLFQENDAADTELKLRYGKSVLYGAPTGAMDFVSPRRLQFFRRHRYYTEHTILYRYANISVYNN